MTRLDVELYTMTAVTGRVMPLSNGREVTVCHACGQVMLVAESKGKQTKFVLFLEAFHALPDADGGGGSDPHCAGIGTGKLFRMNGLHGKIWIQAPNVLEHGGGPKPYRRRCFDAV